MGRFEGKVAVVTGASRGQGRTHAVRLAQEGADVVIVDSCVGRATMPYEFPVEVDLRQTESLVTATGRHVLSRIIDDQDQLDVMVTDVIADFGHIDIVSADVGVGRGPTWDLTEAEWQDVLYINPAGAFQTIKAVAPSMIEAGRGGSIVLTSPIQPMLGSTTVGRCCCRTSTSCVVRLMRTVAAELGPHGIRVNAVGSKPACGASPADVSNAALFLSSDEARYITGIALPIGMGRRLWPDPTEDAAVTPTCVLAGGECTHGSASTVH
ncbi:SDR family oxidoreductase [Prescottella agglutinans]|uniref:SDR family oxidoreductase n=1 Tax=Prescottella agglutinans TaxID=1644129 RepID=A0A3S3ZTA0_9NOCA|nr:SDR family oxidoreductase [Prescottella agglutinans]RVW07812.1 SDR family oxidoreductase [Prescottella agglutinans]